MRYILPASLLFLFPLILEGDEPPASSRYAGACARRCRASARSSCISATLFDPQTNRRTLERVFFYIVGEPYVVCRCESRVSRPPRRGTREYRSDAATFERCWSDCRQNLRMYTGVIVDPNGREHNERISVLSYEPPLAGCLCTGIPVDVPPPAPPRQHPER